MVLKFSNFLKIKVSYYSSKYKQYLCHFRDSHTPLIGRDKWRRETSPIVKTPIHIALSMFQISHSLIHPALTSLHQ
jgi:hypothetical protein